MQANLSEEAVWASGMAARLRVLQANGSETAPSVQQEFIAEELERALKEVVPSKRKLFLQTLGDRFPAWLVAPSASQAVSTKAEIIEDTPERRLESLLQVAPKLSEDQRRDFAGKLKAAGFSVVEHSGSLEATPELQKALGGDVPQLDGDRAVKLLILSASFALTIEQLVWNVWKQIAPRSVVRRDGGPANDIRVLMRRYLAGDSEVSSQQIGQIIEQTRKLTAGLLMAMGGTGREFATSFQRRFAPQEITQLAEIEKKFTEAIEKACWRKYGELFHEFGDTGAIDNLVQETVVRIVERSLAPRQANA